MGFLAKTAGRGLATRCGAKLVKQAESKEESVFIRGRGHRVLLPASVRRPAGPKQRQSVVEADLQGAREGLGPAEVTVATGLQTTPSSPFLCPARSECLPNHSPCTPHISSSFGEFSPHTFLIRPASSCPHA